MILKFKLQKVFELARKLHVVLKEPASFGAVISTIISVVEPTATFVFMS